jgi:hypothetical protein
LLYLLPAGFFLGLLFYPEDGSDMLLQNVSWLSSDYMAVDPKTEFLKNTAA